MLHLLLVATLSAGLAASPSPARPAATAASGAMAGPGGPVALADSIVIEKKAHRLTLYHMGRPLRSYQVALGGQPVGDKRSRGDRRTPEGLFSIDGVNENSDFHLALHISYPDERHWAIADSLGVDPGDEILIHGLPRGRGGIGAQHRVKDWTNGCIALTDEEMEQIWRVVPIGTPVEIKP
jgi:murein L,D-transpeptidase YafK